MTNVKKSASKAKPPKKTSDQVFDKEIKSELEFHEDWVDNVALFITGAFGSIRFLAMCMVLFIVWVCWNLNAIPLLKPFDPYPFQMLTMIVSIFAIILSVSVLISQNREGKKNNIRQQVDFEVNVRAESEITKMLTMLHEIQKQMGIHSKVDTQLEQMKAETDIQEIHHKLDEAAGSKE